MPKFQTIADIPPHYDYIQLEGEFAQLAEIAGLKQRYHYDYGFALIVDGDIVEFWGYEGFVPWLTNRVYQVYSQGE